MKKKIIILFIVSLIMLTGCSSDKAGSKVSATGARKAPETNESDIKKDSTDEENTDTTKETSGLEMPVASDDVIEIKEKLFIAQSNDIYINPDNYIGKTIKYEGIFKANYLEENGETYYFVIRYGPGCCGYDGEAGFEIRWNGTFPKENDWCEVVGVLEEYEEDGWLYLRLVVTSLTVLDERGEEYVYQ